MSDFRRRLAIINWMEDNTEKVKQIEGLIKEAQQLNDIELEYRARSAYMQAVTFNQEPEKMLACFPWLLATHDKYPDKFDIWQLLWYYKWVVGHVAKFPSISKERIMDIMQDMERRYVTGGFGRKTVVYYFRQIYQEFGEPELAEKAHQEWLAMDEESGLSNCTACVLNSWVSHEFWKGNYEQTIEKAQDLLNEKYTCAEVPRRTIPRIIGCHSQLNRLEEAIPLYQKAVSDLKHEKAYLTDYGNIITYLTLTQNDVLAKAHLVKQLPFALNFSSEYEIQEFYIGALFFLTALQNDKEKEISLPKDIELPVKHKNYTYQIADLIAFFDGEIDRITQLFNERNGNDFYTRKKESTMVLLPNRRKVSLS